MIILAIVVLNGAFGALQEGRAQQATRAVRALLEPHAIIVRDGRQREIDAARMVRGDVVVIGMGDRVAADGRIVEATGIEVNEAVLTLTGESLPRSKRVDQPLPRSTALPDRATMVFAGTIVARGRRLVLVTATGRRTEIAAIAQMAAQERPLTPLQRRDSLAGRCCGPAPDLHRAHGSIPYAREHAGAEPARGRVARGGGDSRRLGGGRDDHACGSRRGLRAAPQAPSWRPTACLTTSTGFAAAWRATRFARSCTAAATTRTAFESRAAWRRCAPLEPSSLRHLPRRTQPGTVERPPRSDARPRQTQREQRAGGQSDMSARWSGAGRADG